MTDGRFVGMMAFLGLVGACIGYGINAEIKDAFMGFGVAVMISIIVLAAGHNNKEK